MRQRELFLQSDAALRDVVNRITPDQLDLPAPGDWTRAFDPRLRDVLNDHVRDEAWVPEVLAGRTIEEVGDRFAGDLLGDDPIAAYNAANDAATTAANAELDPGAVVHLSYGDFPVAVYFEHIATYRAFQAWSIAQLIGEDFTLPPELVESLFEMVVPQAEAWRAMGVFGEPVDVPDDADRETQLLGVTGYWRP
jgi:uncharacterized protein (TIGR03086 family)